MIKLVSNSKHFPFPSSECFHLAGKSRNINARSSTILITPVVKRLIMELSQPVLTTLVSRGLDFA